MEEMLKGAVNKIGSLFCLLSTALHMDPEEGCCASVMIRSMSAVHSGGCEHARGKSVPCANLRSTESLTLQHTQSDFILHSCRHYCILT